MEATNVINKIVDAYLSFVNYDYSGMPPVQSQDVVGRCLGNFLGKLPSAIVASPSDYQMSPCLSREAM